MLAIRTTTYDIADKWAYSSSTAFGQGTIRFTQLKAEVAGIDHHSG